jgi:hypothetical protein
MSTEVNSSLQHERLRVFIGRMIDQGAYAGGADYAPPLGAILKPLSQKVFSSWATTDVAGADGEYFVEQSDLSINVKVLNSTLARLR